MWRMLFGSVVIQFIATWLFRDFAGRICFDSGIWIQVVTEHAEAFFADANECLQPLFEACYWILCGNGKLISISLIYSIYSIYSIYLSIYLSI